MHLPTRTPSMLSLGMELEHVLTAHMCRHPWTLLAQGWHPRMPGAHTTVQHMQSTLACWHLRGCGRAWKSW